MGLEASIMGRPHRTCLAVATAVAFALLNTHAAIAQDAGIQWGREGIFGVHANRIVNWNIRYPVLGFTATGILANYPKVAQDDFCASPRPYSNSACLSGTGHSGLDIGPRAGFPTSGMNVGRDQLPVVAAKGGQVSFAGCAASAGYMVKVIANEGGTTRIYKYLHFDSPPAVGVGAVRASQMLGRMGATGDNSCVNGAPSSASNVGLHVHFDTFFGSDNRSTSAYDSYPALRTAWSAPGRDAGVVTQASTTYPWKSRPLDDSALQSKYVSLLNQHGYPGALTFVGWPTGYSYSGDGANVGLATTYRNQSGKSGKYGYKQYLGIGSNGFDPSGYYRASALLHLDGSFAVWTHGRIWDRYVRMSMEASWLGYPITDEYQGIVGTYKGKTRQDYEGGCIVWTGTDPVNPYTAHAYNSSSSSPCTTAHL